MDNSLTLHNLELTLSKCIENIVAEGTVSQNFYIGPCSFSVKFRKNIQSNKKLPVFCHKIGNNT